MTGEPTRASTLRPGFRDQVRRRTPAAWPCSLALLLAVITQALTGTGPATVFLVFAAYAAGSAVLLLTLVVVTAFASTLISRYLRRLLPHMNRITGTILLLSGGYLIVYWLPQLFGGGPGTSALSGAAGSLSGWIRSNQLLIVSVAGVVVAVAVTGALVQRAMSRRLREGDDCCEPAQEPRSTILTAVPAPFTARP